MDSFRCQQTLHAIAAEKSRSVSRQPWTFGHHEVAPTAELQPVTNQPTC